MRANPTTRNLESVPGDALEEVGGTWISFHSLEWVDWVGDLKSGRTGLGVVDGEGKWNEDVALFSALHENVFPHQVRHSRHPSKQSPKNERVCIEGNQLVNECTVINISQ